jgi:hypothetical protein
LNSQPLGRKYSALTTRPRLLAFNLFTFCVIAFVSDELVFVVSRNPQNLILLGVLEVHIRELFSQVFFVFILEIIILRGTN